MILGDRRLDGDQDRAVEIAGLHWTEHGAPPFTMDRRRMLPPEGGIYQQARPFLRQEAFPHFANGSRSETRLVFSVSALAFRTDF